MEFTNERTTPSFSSSACGSSRQVKISFLSVFLFTTTSITSPYSTCDLILKGLVVIDLFFIFFLSFSVSKWPLQHFTSTLQVTTLLLLKLKSHRLCFRFGSHWLFFSFFTFFLHFHAALTTFYINPSSDYFITL